MKGLNYKIVTPEKIYCDANAKMVVIPSIDGEMGICKNHVPILANLQTGFIEIYEKSKISQRILIDSAIAEFSDNHLVILCENIIDINQVNIKELQEEINSLEKKMDSASDDLRTQLQNEINSKNKIIALQKS
jgi:F-type H+-transporting ATPase subunit epsilon